MTAHMERPRKMCCLERVIRGVATGRGGGAAGGGGAGTVPWDMATRMRATSCASSVMADDRPKRLLTF